MQWLIDNRAEIATLVGLIVNYRSLLKEGAQQTKDDFLEWLRRSDQKELVSLIQQHAEIQEAVGQLLIANDAAHGLKLEQIQQTLEAIAKSIQSVSHLPELHAEALHGMATMIRARVKWFTYRHGHLMMGEDFDPFNFQSEDFQGDLDVLEAHGYLRVSFSDDGSPMYHFTRRAFDYVKALPEMR
jgi:hypothetical protein